MLQKFYKQDKQEMPLISWIWRSYFKTSLIPLLVVEVALILLYFLSNSFTNQYNIEAVREIAQQTIRETVNREASSINQQLKSISSVTGYLAEHTRQVMSGEIPIQADNPSYYAYSDDGVFYTTEDHGRGALFYSGFYPIGEKQRQKAFTSAGLDSAYQGILASYPLAIQLYYNTYDSMNRIFPYIDVMGQYEAKMDIPSYNFYYEADGEHNPDRNVVWTDVYLDPAGQGWMTSAIAPVYTDDFLEGVFGIDITVGTVIEQVLNIDIPWGGYGLLIGRDGTIIAMPEQAEPDWSLNEVTSHTYTEAIRQDTFKPEEFNLYNRLSNRDLAKQLQVKTNGLQHVELSEQRILTWATIPETGWKLLISVPERQVYQTANSLADRLSQLAWLVILAMVVFYILFFSALYYRAKKMSQFISTPLEKIDDMTLQISQGQYQLTMPDLMISELNRTAQDIQQMGRDLDNQFQLREKAETALYELSSRLQTIFDVSPDGFVTIDTSDRVTLVNPAFCKMTATTPGVWIGRLRTEFWDHVRRFSSDKTEITSDEASFIFHLSKPEWRVIQCKQHTGTALTLHTDTKSVIFFNDITVSAELEKMKNNFLQAVAHELRTPLAVVLGYAELLSNNKLDLEHQQSVLESIVKETQSLVKVINDILVVTRIDNIVGTISSTDSVNLDSLIANIIDKRFDQEQRSRINLDLDSKQEKVEINQEFFAIVLTHLIDNAIKFSTSGSDVTVQTVVKPSDAKVIVNVIDQGVGMSASQLKFAFERFWRKDNTGKTSGTGLGLAIVKDLTEKMGIELTINSIEEQGTCVSLQLSTKN